MLGVRRLFHQHAGDSGTRTAGSVGDKLTAKGAVPKRFLRPPRADGRDASGGHNDLGGREWLVVLVSLMCSHFVFLVRRWRFARVMLTAHCVQRHARDLGAWLLSAERLPREEGDGEA